MALSRCQADDEKIFFLIGRRRRKPSQPQSLQFLPALRRHKGHLQTVGLLCPEGQREELAELFLRCGLTRILRPGAMSDVFCGEAHDGEYPLRRYTRMVDIQ